MKIKAHKYAARGRIGIQSAGNGKRYLCLYFIEVGWFDGLYIGFCLPFLDSFNNSIAFIIKKSTTNEPNR